MERQEFRRLVDSFLTDNDLDIVVLGCTELPLVYGQISDQRVISTLDVLSTELLKRYFEHA